MSTTFDNFVEQIDRVIIAHIEWKNTLDEVFKTRKSSISVEHAANDSLCDFGRWLTGPNVPPSFLLTERYTKISRLHYDFHKAAAVVLDLALRLCDVDDLVLDVAFREYNHASNELMRELLDWKDEEVGFVPTASEALF